jgi:hypothetical protein
MKVTTKTNQKVIANFTKKDFEDLLVESITNEVDLCNGKIQEFNTNEVDLCNGKIQEFKLSLLKEGGVRVEFFLVED